MVKITSPEKPWYLPSIREFLLSDVPAALRIPAQSFARDVDTLERRLATEGDAFLTKTLPQLGKAIDLALQGDSPLRTSSFRKPGRTALPAFLRALLRRIFSVDGWVKEECCIVSIRLVRQLCYWCKKVQKGYSDESLQKALASFISDDEALPSCFADVAEAADHLGVARAVVELVLRKCGGPLDFGPCHGPGAVAGGEDALAKRCLKTSYEELEKYFRPIPWFRSLRDAAEDPQTVLSRPKKPFGLSRTEFVEKDSSGPRTIGLEPAEYMWCQQGVKRLLYNHIETKSIAKGQINFTDQSVNRALARNWIDFETLDMSRASDRNSLVLVEQLFCKTEIWPALRACRTPGTVLPNGRVLMYKKFAPMGSAVCFPVEALVFYALAVAVLHMSGMPLFLALRRVYVYGDDLIVPRGYYASLDKVFTQVGLKFSVDKCCVSGKFRESCGFDAFDGVKVTPVRLKVVTSTSDQDLVRILEHCNALNKAGYRSAAEAYEKAAKENFPKFRKIPAYSHPSLPCIYWYKPDSTTALPLRTKDGVTKLKGWSLEAAKLKSDGSCEGAILRESLSLGGPVGCICPDSGLRALTARFSSGLRKKKFTVLRENRAPDPVSVKSDFCLIKEDV